MADSANMERRSEILRAYFHRRAALDRLRKARDGATGPEREQFARMLRSVDERIGQLTDQYRELLEPIALSRCPFCSAPTVLSFDPHGIDGLYWSYDAPAQKADPRPCPHFLVLAGAMKLVLPPASSGMLVIPGPEAPWVTPSLLGLSTVRAVVASLPIGPHTGFPIAYFADPDPGGDLVNAWGRSHYERVDARGNRTWNEVVENDVYFDFDLAPWIDREKLWWIAPGDGELALRRGPAGCPYVGLPGRRAMVKVQSGLSWVHGWEVRGKL